MSKEIIVFASICCLSFNLMAQDEDELLMKVDDLRYRWDDEALNLETFVGMENFCHVKKYKKEVTLLLNSIHHFDTLLFGIVTEKFNQTADLQAQEALKDILLVESEYTTLNFLEFLELECSKVVKIEKIQAKKTKEIDAKTAALEKELIRYIDSVTERIDLIDENVHHLR